MALSNVIYTGTGSQTDYTFAFPYLERSDIFVHVNGLSVPFTFITASAIRTTSAPIAGSVVAVKRLTQKLVVPVDFVDGSNLLESDLDRFTLWSLYQAQESSDNSGDSSNALIAAQVAALAAQVAASAFPGFHKSQTFIATAGQVLFTLAFGYALGVDCLQVYINGANQEPQSFTETSTSSITLDEPLSAGDIVYIRTATDSAGVGAALTTSPGFSTTPTLETTAAEVIYFGALTANVTAFNLSGTRAKVVVAFKQDGTGSRTVAAGASIDFGGDILDLSGISASANAYTYVGFIYHPTSAKFRVVAISK